MVCTRIHPMPDSLLHLNHLRKLARPIMRRIRRRCRISTTSVKPQSLSVPQCMCSGTPQIPLPGQLSCTAATVNTNPGTGPNGNPLPYQVTPSTCYPSSIPVPLGAIDWTWSACAINSLAPTGSGGFLNSWNIPCGVGTQTPYENSIYPIWASGSQGCYASANAKCQ